MFLAKLVQNADIDEKINNAPNNRHEIGVFIGSMLPFVVLVGIAFNL